MSDFWLSCGHHLLDRSDGGGLVVTDEFLKAYLARPELAPPPEACAVERTLHAALLADPRRPVAPADISAMADADARENWEAMIAFRDRLLRHPTLEAAYIALVRHGAGKTPPLFLSQLVHVILRNILDRCDDPLVLRAAELFFRTQRVTLHDGALLAADEERIADAMQGQLSPLVGLLGLDKAANIDVLTPENADVYWERSDRFDMAIDLTAGRAGLDALARVIERWVEHLLHVRIKVEPLVEIRDAALTWYVGLYSHPKLIGDALWDGEPIDDETRSRVVGLFTASFGADAPVLDQVRGEAAFLLMAMTPEKILRLKPQNLIAGLPLKSAEAGR